jgi:hypothetical protein
MKKLIEGSLFILAILSLLSATYLISTVTYYSIMEFIKVGIFVVSLWAGFKIAFNFKVFRLYLSKPRKILTIIGVLLVLTACSPTKRIARIHSNNPGALTMLKDSVTVKDTINIQIDGSEAKGAFHKDRLVDTVYVSNGVSNTIVYQVNDTIYVNNKLDTFFVEVPFETTFHYSTYEVKENVGFNYQLWFIILVVTAVGTVAFMILKRTLWK